MLCLQNLLNQKVHKRHKLIKIQQQTHKNQTKIRIKTQFKSQPNKTSLQLKIKPNPKKNTHMKTSAQPLILMKNLRNKDKFIFKQFKIIKSLTLKP